MAIYPYLDVLKISKYKNNYNDENNNNTYLYDVPEIFEVYK